MMVSGAGSAPARSRMARSLALCTVKLPEICPEPPRIGSRITGAEITSLSSTMAKGLPTFSCVTCGEFARARGVEAEGDDRLAGALIEARLRVGQVAARHQDALLDHVGRPWLRCRCRREFRLPAAAGPAAPARPVIVDVDHAEIELGGLAEQFLQPRRILQARHLHQDAVGRPGAGSAARRCRAR